MNTKPIQIFIAATPELENELYSIHDLIQQVNKHFRARGYELQAVDGDSADFVQDLHESDLCLALYCNQFGSFKQEHLEDAYKELCENRNPKKIYIYFKNTDAITEELRIFRDSFSEKYGHFYCHFENVDTMKLNFLLQCEGYITQSGQEGLLNVSNSYVEINGEEFVNLQNVSFASNNPDYLDLLEEVQDAYENMQEYPDNPKFKEKYHKLLQKCNTLENNLLATAKRITQLSTSKISSRLAEAIRLFEQGDNRGADTILNQEHIDQDMDANVRSYDYANKMEQEWHKTKEEARQAIEQSLEEYQLKIQTLQNNMAEDWFEKVVYNYDKAVTDCRNRIDNKKFAELLFDYAYFLQENHEHRAIELYSECLSLYRTLAKTNPDIFDYKIALTLNNIGLFYHWIGLNEKAEQAYQEALLVNRSLVANYKNNKFKDGLATTLFNIGLLHHAKYVYKQAESEFAEALIIRRKLAAEYPEKCEGDLVHLLRWYGESYAERNLYSQADEKLQEALQLSQKLAHKHPERYEKYLADVLCGYGNLHFKMEQYSIAESEYEEALSIYSRLTQFNPENYAISLSNCLSNYAVLHTVQKSYDAAEEKYNEAVSICRRWAKQIPTVLLIQSLITMLQKLVAFHVVRRKNERKCEIENEYTELVQIHRYLVDNKMGMHEEGLADSLKDIAIWYKEQHEYDRSKTEYLEALFIYRRLAKMETHSHCDEKIKTILLYLGDVYYLLNDKKQSKEAYQEAVSIARKMAARESDKYPTILAHPLRDLGDYYYREQLYEEAEKNYRESIIYLSRSYETARKWTFHPLRNYIVNVLERLTYIYAKYPVNDQLVEKYQEILDTYRLLVVDYPSDYQHALAKILNTIGNVHRTLKQYVQSEKHYIESLELYQKLTKENGEQYNGEMAGILNCLGIVYYNLKQYTQAETYYVDSLTLYRALADKQPEKFNESIAIVSKNLGNLLYYNLLSCSRAKQNYTESLLIYQGLHAKKPCYLSQIDYLKQKLISLE